MIIRSLWCDSANASMREEQMDGRFGPEALPGGRRGQMYLIHLFLDSRGVRDAGHPAIHHLHHGDPGRLGSGIRYGQAVGRQVSALV